MVTKFSNATTASDYYNRIRNIALAIVLVGVVLGVTCVVAAVCHLILWGNPLIGSLLIIFGVLGSAAFILYAHIGLRKRYLANSIANGIEESITTFDELGISLEEVGQGINIVKQIAYQHIAKVEENNIGYQICTCDGLRLTCLKINVIEGDISLLSEFLDQILGAKYVDRRKPISATKDSLADIADVEENAVHDAADNNVTEENNNDNQQ